MRSSRAFCVSGLMAALVLASSGCHQTPTVAPDTHQYTAEEAKAAYQQHMRSAGPHTSAPGNASQPATGK